LTCARRGDFISLFIESSQYLADREDAGAQGIAAPLNFFMQFLDSRSMVG